MLRRIVAGAAVAAAVLAFAAPAAFAHVTVQPGEAARGSYTQLTFRVPNETDNTDTTEVRVQLPTDHPIASVSVEPVPGWTVATKKTKLATPITSDDGSITDAISEIAWTGGKIAPGEYQNFNISAGPLPTDVDQLTFKAIQTYSDGSEVAWIEETPASGEEPEHPAPTLKLTASSGDVHGGSAPAETTVPSSSGSSTSSVDKSDVDSANSRATIALVIGVLGLLAGLGGVGLALGRRSSS